MQWAERTACNGSALPMEISAPVSSLQAPGQLFSDTAPGSYSVSERIAEEPEEFERICAWAVQKWVETCFSPVELAGNRMMG